MAHALAEGHYAVGLLGFAIASFGICWAWTNFTWFASAYDTDDWVFRIVTMVQMIGVLVLAIGVPQMFASIEHGEYLDGSIMVLGYVIMRFALVFQWLRASREDPARRRACLTYAAVVSLAQVGWVVLIVLHLAIGVTASVIAILALVEVAGPILAEREGGGTPWHAHHIAERHGLFAIIALGEGVVAQSLRCRQLSNNRNGRWTQRSSAWRAPASPSECGGSTTCCRQRRFCTSTASVPSFGATASY